MYYVPCKHVSKVKVICIHVASMRCPHNKAEMYTVIPIYWYAVLYAFTYSLISRTDRITFIETMCICTCYVVRARFSMTIYSMCIEYSYIHT